MKRIDARTVLRVVWDMQGMPVLRSGGSTLSMPNPFVYLSHSARAWLATVLVCAVIGMTTAQPARATQNVDLVLVLALDVSSSVDPQEFHVQRSGLVEAFRHASVIKAILDGQHKRIAVMAVQWAGYQQQQIMIPWTLITRASDALSFADRLAAMPRAFPNGATHLSGVIEFSTKLALAAPYVALRRVIDISGDGVDNVKGRPDDARDTAVAGGMTINGLAIANEDPDLLAYYRAHVIGGPSAFALEAREYKAYPAAILRKLVREIETRLIF